MNWRASSWGYVAWWVGLLVLHCINFGYYIGVAKLYTSFKYTYTMKSIQTLSIGIDMSQYAKVSATHATIAAVHAVLILLMLIRAMANSRRVGSLLNGSKSAPAGSILAAETDPVSSIRDISHHIAESMSRTGSIVFARDGLLGVASVYFDHVLLVRELVETGLQTYQAYRMTHLLPRLWLIRFYVALLVANCWSVPLLHRYYRDRETTRRMLCLLCDATLDMVSSIGVSIIIFAQYVPQYNDPLLGFPLSNWYDDHWLANMQQEFQIMLVAWSSGSNAVAAAAGAVLRRLCSGGPAAKTTGSSRFPPQPPRLQTTLAATGHVALRSTRAIPRTAAECEALTPLLPASGRGRRDEKWWTDGWLHCRYEANSASLAHLRRVQSRLYGSFTLPALLVAPTSADSVLYYSSGEPVVRADFPSLLDHGMAIGDVLELEWVRPRHLRFRSRRYAWPMSPKIVDEFRRFCDTVVHNYPALLLPQNAPDELQPRPPSAAAWRLRDDAGVRTLVHEPVVDARVDVGVVQTMAAAVKLARHHDSALVRFDPHPLLDAYAPLWTQRGTPSPSQSTPVTASQARARREVDGRARQATAADATIGQALATVSWKDVAKLPASSSRQRLLVHKIKGLRLSGWDRGSSSRGCPHCTRAPGFDHGHTYHIMWHCPAAQALWTRLRLGWARLGVLVAASATEFCSAVFSLRLTQTPPAAWAFLGRTGVDADLIPLVHNILATVWQQQVLGCFQQIWSWRHSVADEALPWTLLSASSALRGSMRHAFYQAATTLRVPGAFELPLRRMLHGLERLQLDPEPIPTRRLTSTTDRHLLFFDGGSRGNPGPGGSGAVVIRVDAFGGHPSIVWAAAMSLASPTTTNNQAEYSGLVTGLRFASKRQLRPLTVIGDSAMIISQLRTHRAPKDQCLKERYGEARILADVLGITEWCHHVRAFNKMADCAANLAMDSRSSVQTLDPLARSSWSELATYLHEDVAQWQASTYPGPTSAG